MDVIKLHNIVKNFEGIQALKGVDFELECGEVHVLLGENGAGKSTLIKVIAGIYKPTSGEIFLNGQQVTFASPKDAERHGIGVIHQEQNLLLDKSVAENLFIGREYTKFGLIDYKRMRKETKKYLAMLGVDIDPQQPIRELGIAQRQMIEIAKALSKTPKVLIMDEPTAALTTGEIQNLFKVIRKLQSEGISIIYISHRMEEIFQIATRVTILRDGAKVDSAPIDEMSMDRIVVGMVGRNVDAANFRVKSEVGEIALKLEHMSGDRFTDCSLEVRKGEIVGLAGLVGAGRTELVEAAFGIRPYDSGKVFINGAEITPAPKTSVKAGLGFLPEDRKRDALILDKSIRENIVLPSRTKLHKFGVINLPKEREITGSYIDKMSVATTTGEKHVVELSGGTQQKVIIARWLCGNSDVIIFDEPTRGVDIGSREEIYDLMNELTAKGAGILMVSSDLLELLGVTDRVYTMYKGRITGESETSTLTRDSLFSKCISAGKVDGE